MTAPVKGLAGTDERGHETFELLLAASVRDEQQALAKFDLNDVLNEYLSEKPKQPESCPPLREGARPR